MTTHQDIPVSIHHRISGNAKRSITKQLNLSLWIIIFVLLATALLAYHFSARQSMFFLALVGTGIATLVFLRWPSLGLATLIIAAMTIPFEIGTGTKSGINVAILLVAFLTGLWLLDLIVHKQPLNLHWPRIIWPLLGLGLVVILAFLVGQFPWFPLPGAPMRAQIGGLAIYLLSIFAFLLAAYQISDLRWLKRLTWLFLLLGAFYIVGRLFHFNWLTQLFVRPATGSLFWTWLVAMAFSQALFNNCLHPGIRAALGALTLATLYVSLINKDWVSGWIPSLVALGGVLVIAAPWWSLGALVAALFGGLWKFQAVASLVMEDNRVSYDVRLSVWRTLFQNVIKVNPMLGLGPANYYWYMLLFPFLGGYRVYNSHNQYVDLLARTGILGLFFYLWFFGEMLYLAWRMRTKLGDGFARAYVYGVFGGVLGTLAAGMLGDWVLPFVYNIGLAGFRASVLGWLFMGGLLALVSFSLPKSVQSV